MMMDLRGEKSPIKPDDRIIFNRATPLAILPREHSETFKSQMAARMPAGKESVSIGSPINIHGFIEKSYKPLKVVK
jgi:hypothetical protein